MTGRAMKRLFDVFCSFLGLVLLAPVFLGAAILVKLDSKGPVFFKHARIGKDFRPFRVYKFRTMHEGAEQHGASVTVGSDARITKLGRLLRRTKIDELPQLLNVLKGDMSLVGPRPEVKKYVDLYEQEYRKLLTLRPGITDPASLRYSEEEKVLALSPDWEEDYRTRILPDKIRLSLQYVEDHSLGTDLSLILRTIMKTSGMDRQHAVHKEHI
ncbi:MAG: sugar transferase [Nitrospirae bacterium]|nr:sugar transferase [Nitrospirota bacterium]